MIEIEIMMNNKIFNQKIREKQIENNRLKDTIKDWFLLKYPKQVKFRDLNKHPELVGFMKDKDIYDILEEQSVDFIKDKDIYINKYNYPEYIFDKNLDNNTKATKIHQDVISERVYFLPNDESIEFNNFECFILKSHLPFILKFMIGILVASLLTMFENYFNILWIIFSSCYFFVFSYSIADCFVSVFNRRLRNVQNNLVKEFWHDKRFELFSTYDGTTQKIINESYDWENSGTNELLYLLDFIDCSKCFLFMYKKKSLELTNDIEDKKQEINIKKIFINCIIFFAWLYMSIKFILDLFINEKFYNPTIILAIIILYFFLILISLFLKINLDWKSMRAQDGFSR